MRFPGLSFGRREKSEDFMVWPPLWNRRNRAPVVRFLVWLEWWLVYFVCRLRVVLTRVFRVLLRRRG